MTKAQRPILVRAEDDWVEVLIWALGALALVGGVLYLALT